MRSFCATTFCLASLVWALAAEEVARGQRPPTEPRGQGTRAAGLEQRQNAEAARYARRRGAAVMGEPLRPILPEQRNLAIRSPEQMPRAHLPDVEVPTTVAASPQKRQLPEYLMTLDEAIRIALENSEVIRVLAGSGAAFSGSTVYDPAVTNTEIDRARARFDPTFGVQNRFNSDKLPVAEPDPGAPSGVSIDGDRVRDYEMSLGVSKATQTGGSAGLNVRASPTTVDTPDPLLLNPESRSAVDFRLSQPLLQGAGRRANLTPIVLARIDTERSFYQLKLSVQRLVQSVVDAYWSLVLARTEAFVRRQQTEQGRTAWELAEANLATGRGNRPDVSQAKAAWLNFRVAEVTAEANVLQREQALRDILGLEPYDGLEVVPVTMPTDERIEIDWEESLELAERYRCDLIERKLVVEAAERQLLLARNTALPRVDASARYGWNGLEGRTPTGDYLVGSPGDFPGWQLGIDVSMPLGLREERAELRRQQLLLARDRANLHEALRQASHSLARTYRNLAQFYQEYQAAKEARIAARVNYENQNAQALVGRTIYLNVLQAITSYANAISAEAQALLRYNSELAAFELEMGTILETHGIAFYEEGFRSMGPAGRLAREHCYPRATVPGDNADRYSGGEEPSEEAFDLDELPPTRSE